MSQIIEIEKRTHLSLLFDFYGALLTEKQRLMFDLYYQNDLSLGEIAEEQGISRQAVYDILKRSESILGEYENKLHLAEKFIKTNEKLKKALNVIDDIKEENSLPMLKQLKEIIVSLIEED